MLDRIIDDNLSKIIVETIYKEHGFKVVKLSLTWQEGFVERSNNRFQRFQVAETINILKRKNILVRESFGNYMLNRELLINFK